MKQLRGIVMCGGQSKRMGTDKGLIAIQDTCWAAYMAAKLVSMNLPVSISINASQLENYTSIFPAKQLIVDSLNIGGPLNGLLSVHEKYPNDNLLLLACDMINMQAETLCHLVSSYKAEPAYDFYIYQNKEYAEPFCGIYTGEGLSILIRSIDVRNLSGLSLKKVLYNGNTKHLEIIETVSFSNHNT
jgi:molybdopterin-guanine dinucleotide biosynthesis protein A